MPYRKEKYIFLEQSVTVDSKEVDALVTKIGEALQLHNNAGANPKAASCFHGLNGTGTGTGSVTQSNSNNNNNNNSAALHKRTGCCVRLRNRGLRSRASPYTLPGSSDQEWDRFRTWNRKGIDVPGEEDDPHRLLQELILSGNLIKEAVRRLQFSASESVEHSKSADNVHC
ncbi:glycogen synthase kinase binding protein [Brienomyrus brachyistius]|uniref:glycogen synthase kinase binding protein n=1 Tax=Brienomyrus brachyistius TaxID=42636 RepID=UPI0020B29E7A|nr:glycogen synthase kinase binding protein [Brienomyrus brachyistius]